MLREAAAREGITITGYSFTLENGRGDDARSYEFVKQFHEDHGVLRLPKGANASILKDLEAPREWRVYVSCDFRFSV